MKRNTILCSLCYLLFSFSSFAQLPIYNMKVIDEAKSLYLSGNKQIVRIIQNYREQADQFILLPDLSVTDKTKCPPSGDKRDYMSQAPYWWPDPDKPDGLPYIRHDGVTNPEIRNYPDLGNRALLSTRTQVLGILYYFTGEEKYAQKCASLIRTWFLDPEKGMNPNLDFAEARIGHDTGRDAGIIQAYPMLRSFAGLYSIRDSKSWTEEDASALKEWSWNFWYWLTHSRNGINESHAPNNHSLNYEATRLYAMSLFATPEEILKSVKESMLPRLSTQIAEDGSLPQELARTRGLMYCCTALRPLIDVDAMCANFGYSIWDYTAPNGRRLEQAIDYVAPYLWNPEKWPFQQLDKFDQEIGSSILYHASQATGRKDWERYAKKIGLTLGKKAPSTLLYYQITK